MKITTRGFLLFFIILLSASGCDDLYRPQESQPRDKMFYTQDLELAKTLLWPEPKEVTVDRDVFKPLVTDQETTPTIRSDQDSVLSLRLSATFLSDHPVAFVQDIKTGKRIVAKLGDQIGDYTVVEIRRKEILLKKDDKEILLSIEEDRK